MRSLLALVLLVSLCAGAGLVLAQESMDAEILESKRQLEALRKQAEDARQKVRETKQKEQSVLERVSEADQAVAATTGYSKKRE